MKGRQAKKNQITGWALVNDSNKSLSLVKAFTIDIAVKKGVVEEKLIPTFKLQRVKLIFLD